MFTTELKEKYQFLTDYFEAGLKNSYDKDTTKAIAHSILFYGQDISAQYSLAMEIARLLNCHELQNKECHCLNCNWVRDRQHPAVMTISKLDNKPPDDESKTVISVKQSQMIKNSLLNTSDYHRVFIFCDAEIQDGIWKPLGLNENNFHQETANSLLKIIEEPPENTTFFFLARDKNDLIGTIISRSQSFFVPSYDIEDKYYSTVEDALADYPEIDRKDSLDLAQSLFLLSKEHGSEKVLTEVQNFLLVLLKSNLDNNEIKRKVLSDIKSVELAKKQLNSRIQPQLAFEDMCLNFTK